MPALIGLGRLKLSDMFPVAPFNGYTDTAWTIFPEEYCLGLKYVLTLLTE